jgi:hypothetical protein
MSIDTATLLAFLDGELDADEARRVEAALAADPDLRARHEEQRRLREQLSRHYGAVTEEPVPPAMRALLDPGVVDLAAERRRRRPRWLAAGAALAASLVLGIGIGRLLPADGNVSIADGGLVARGALAETLDSQLASAQPGDAAIRIGVSFARADGNLCRTFQSAEFGGLACREGDAWRLMMTARGSGGVAGDYRQAGADSPLVLQAAQDMMSGEPFDAAAERRARDSGWRAAR